MTDRIPSLTAAMLPAAGHPAPTYQNTGERLMGYIAHHAIIITSGGDQTALGNDLRTAVTSDGSDDLTGLLIGPTPSVTNGYVSWVVVPDGSKEGWETSDAGDALRDRVVAVCRRHGVDFAEVRFGGDDYDMALVTRHGGDDESFPGPASSGAEKP